MSVNQSERSAKMLRPPENSANPFSTPPAEEEISLLDLVIVIVRHRRLILKKAAYTIAIAVIVSLLLPIRYTAMTSLLPPQQGTSTGSALLSQLGSLGSVASFAGGGNLGLKNPSDLQVAMLKSRTIEDAMIDRFHLMDLFGDRKSVV